MQGRVKTGHQIENDRLDIIHPVGFLGRVAPGDKVEIFTMDVGGDPSRRVILGVLGDRATHPKIQEGEAIVYSPGNPKKFVRVYSQQGGAGARDAAAPRNGGGDSAEGVQIEGDTGSVSVKTKKKVKTEAGESTETKAPKHDFIGNHNVDGFGLYTKQVTAAEPIVAKHLATKGYVDSKI